MVSRVGLVFMIAAFSDQSHLFKAVLVEVFFLKILQIEISFEFTILKHETRI